MAYVGFWLASSVLLSIFSHNIVNTLQGFGWAFLFSCILIHAAQYCRKFFFTPYVLFFAISLSSLLGFSKVLTGSHAESSIAILSGLSFYTASIAYLLGSNKLMEKNTVWKVSNPLLLFTGPIALFIKDTRHRSLKLRLQFYLPFIVVGAFYFQIVGAPLVAFLFLLNETDVISSLVFSAIFELFVYANFCGLSLLVFGIAGVFGFKVPLNFRQPFSATNLIEFWKGWHTSLSVVLKALFYNPLRKKTGLFAALLAVYLGSAMWHGITFNFLLWGTFHALLFYTTILILRSEIPFKSVITCTLMFFAIVIGRLLFSDSDTGRLLKKLHFSFVDFRALDMLLSVPGPSLLALCIGGFLIALEIIFRNNRYVSKRNYKHLRVPLSQLLLMLGFLLLATNVGGDYAVYGQR